MNLPPAGNIFWRVRFIFESKLQTILNLKIMGFVVLHLDKSPGNESAMTSHINRTVIHPNVDPTRTHLNKELIEFPEDVKDRTEAIQHRLDNAGLKRKIGKNQVQVIRVMLTGSHEDIERINAGGKLDDWCNDNLDWLSKTFGKENVVSATLHMDEETPHIHASVVPIVTGERRKKKSNKPEPPGKKQYRKKNREVPRLCADDVMARDKLKEYQNTYAIAMNKYGLQRGVDGSEARHISTQQFYRDVIANKKNLQENIELLSKEEESKRQDIEILNQRKQDAHIRAEQATVLQQQKESELKETDEALKQVKGQLKTEKLKNTAADVGSTIMEGIGSVIGTSKVKRQQQEIENLKSENHELKQDIAGLSQTINRERKEHEKETGALKAEINKIHDWLPDTPTLIKWGEYCQKIGFTKNQARDIISMKPVRFSGELYSNEHSQRFKANDVGVRLERGTESQSTFRLFIDKISLSQWFKQKYREFQEALDIKPKQKPEMEKNKGIRM
jgi:uncharacterized protein (UPF0254 family)